MIPTRAQAAVGRAMRPLQEFVQLESSGGMVLLGGAVLAMLIANSPLSDHYTSLLNVAVEVKVGTLKVAKPLLLWINDGLMAIFFLLVGLELKREVLEGHLSTLRRASLPLVAAVGGMAVPAAIYVTLNRGDPQALSGWAIPSATDIAFALGVLTLLGDRVPIALKAFLLSVAVFDDLGAIIVIALFYSSDLSVLALLVAAGFVAGLLVLNRLGVVARGAYFVLGVPLWVAVLKSGVHATLAGVVLAMFIPIRDHRRQEPDGQNGRAASPLYSLEHALHPWVAFGVLPVFAFANAGVSVAGLSLADLAEPVPLGIAAGLVVGKQFGILAASWLAVRARVATLAEGVTWSSLYGAAVLCGIGFTMSLFISSLAFGEGASAYGGLDRLGILSGSILSGAIGYAVLRRVLAGRTIEAPEAVD